MAYYGSPDVAFVLVDGYDITSLLPDGLQDEGIEAILDEIHSLGDGYQRFADSGVTKALQLTLGALYDDTVDKTATVFVDSQGNFRSILWAVGGNVIGRRFQGYAGQAATKIKRICQIAKLHRINAQYVASGPAEEGRILHALGADVADGDTTATPHDWSTDARARSGALVSNSVAAASVLTTSAAHGLVTGQKVIIAGVTGSTPTIAGERVATVLTPTTFSIPVTVTVAGTGGTFTQANTPNGGSGYVACSALTLGGFDDVTVTIQHSQDNITYVDLIVFTPITAAPAAERLTVAGTVYRYTASAVAFTGSGASPSATFVAGLHRADDR